MKYLAILKDSLREAIDAKVFYVTVAISVLVSLAVLTVTYRPIPMIEMVEQFTDLMNFVTRSRSPEAPKMGLPGVKETTISDFKRLDEGTDAWTGNYEFTMDLELWDEAVEPKAPQPKGGEDPKDQQPKPQAKAAKITANSMTLPLTMFYQWFDSTTVTALPSADPKHLRFDVKTNGIKRGYRTRQEWFHQPAPLFGLVTLPIKFFKLEQIVRFIGNDVIGSFGAAVTMLLSCIITAFFLPNMMAKGTIDLLVVKPINRVTLFIYKFLGGMTFMLINTSVVMLGVWFGLGVQSGFWVPGFLLCIPIFTFEFMVFYSVSALSGVLTRSAIVSILSVCMLWALLTLIGYAYWFGVEQYKVQDLPTGVVEIEGDTKIRQPPEGWGITVIEVFHALLPRYKDLDWLTAKAIKLELIKPDDLSRPELADNYRFQQQVIQRQYGTYTWGPALGASTLFICIMVGLAAWRFTARDY
jgi:ABC-type transport system involved in multi-copper enzyme maturation permease subunit